MEKFIAIEDIRYADIAESTFGDVILSGNKVIIPYFNVLMAFDLMYSVEGKMRKKQYIQFCYLVFEEVTGITWDYEQSRAMGSDNRRCYGGIYYYDAVDYEFWIKYKQGKIFAKEDSLTSIIPTRRPEELRDFFEESNDVQKIKKMLM